MTYNVEGALKIIFLIDCVSVICLSICVFPHYFFFFFYVLCVTEPLQLHSEIAQASTVSCHTNNSVTGGLPSEMSSGVCIRIRNSTKVSERTLLVC